MGRTPRPTANCGQNDRHTRLKTLPSSKLRLYTVKMDTDVAASWDLALREADLLIVSVN